jgi:hypothetical protein
MKVLSRPLVLLAALLIGLGATCFWAVNEYTFYKQSPKTIRIVSVSGKPLKSFFAGLPRNSHLLEAIHSYRPPQCGRREGPLAKLGSMLGLSQTVYAQAGLGDCGPTGDPAGCYSIAGSFNCSGVGCGTYLAQDSNPDDPQGGVFIIGGTAIGCNNQPFPACSPTCNVGSTENPACPTPDPTPDPTPE